MNSGGYLPTSVNSIELYLRNLDPWKFSIGTLSCQVRTMRKLNCLAFRYEFPAPRSEMVLMIKYKGGCTAVVCNTFVLIVNSCRESQCLPWIQSDSCRNLHWNHTWRSFNNMPIAKCNDTLSCFVIGLVGWFIAKLSSITKGSLLMTLLQTLKWNTPLGTWKHDLLFQETWILLLSVFSSTFYST